MSSSSEPADSAKDVGYVCFACGAEHSEPRQKCWMCGSTYLRPLRKHEKAGNGTKRAPADNGQSPKLMDPALLESLRVVGIVVLVVGAIGIALFTVCSVVV